MAKGKSNAAEELNTAPELEVLDGAVPVDTGEAAIVDQEEITALLEKMAEQNEEKLSEVDSVASDPTSVELNAQTSELEVAEELTAEQIEPNTDSPTNAAPVDVEQVAQPVKTAHVEREAGPSFTIDQVLQAASTSTGFSVDEIKNFEVEELPIESESEIEHEAADHGDYQVQNDDGPNEYVEGFSELPSSAEAKIGQAPSSSAGKASGIQKQKPDSRAKLPEWAMVVAGVVVSIVGGYFLSNMQAHTLERKISAKVSKIDTSLTELSELVEGTNSRLANLDRSLSTGEPNVPKAEVKLSTPQSKEATDHNAAAGHDNASTKKVNSDPGHKAVEKSTAHAAKAPEHKKPPVKGDNFDEEALTEGFHSGTLLIAGKGHSNANAGKLQSLKTRTCGTNRYQRRGKAYSGKSVPASKMSNSVRVYLNGERVSLGHSSGPRTQASAHSNSHNGR